MRPDKITLALGFLLLTASCLPAAVPLHSMSITSHAAHPFVLVGDANGDEGGNGGA